MRKIYINDQVLEFDGAIRLIINGPVENSDMSNSLPAKIPLTDVNNAVFSQRLTSYAFRFVFSIIQFEGTAQVKYTDEYAECTFLLDSSFFKIAKEKAVNELDWGGNRDITESGTITAYTHMRRTLLHPSQYKQYAFPHISNAKIVDGWPGTLPSTVLFNISDVTLQEPTSDFHLYTPFVYLKYILENIFSQCGIEIVSNVFDNESLAKILLFSNTTINDKMRFVIVSEWANLTNRITSIVRDNDDIIISTLDTALYNALHPYARFTGTGTDLDNANAIKYELTENGQIKLTSCNANVTSFHQHTYKVNQLDWKYYDSGSGGKWKMTDFIIEGEIDTSILTPNSFTIAANTELETEERIVTHEARFDVYLLNNYKKTYYLYKTDNNRFTYFSDWLPLIIDSGYLAIVDNAYNEAPKSIAHYDVSISSAIERINLANHVPSVNIADFLEKIEQSFGIFAFVSPFSRKVRIKSFIDIITGTANDITSLAAKADDTEAETPTGYRVMWQEDSTDEYWSNVTERFLEQNEGYNFRGSVASTANISNPENNDVCLLTTNRQYWVYRQEYLSTTGAWEFLSNAVTELDKSSGFDTFEDYTIPITAAFDTTATSKTVGIHSPANCIAIPSLKNELALRMFFYDGIYNGHPVTTDTVESLSLNLKNANNLYEVYLKAYLYWKYNLKTVVKKKIDWSLFDLANLDLSQKQRIDGAEYIIHSIVVDTYIDQLKFDKTTLLKV